MSAETKATRAVVYAIGVLVPKHKCNTLEHEWVVAKPSPNASAIPPGGEGRRRLRQVCSQNEPDDNRRK